MQVRKHVMAALLAAALVLSLSACGGKDDEKGLGGLPEYYPDLSSSSSESSSASSSSENQEPEQAPDISLTEEPAGDASASASDPAMPEFTYKLAPLYSATEGGLHALWYALELPVGWQTDALFSEGFDAHILTKDVYARNTPEAEYGGYSLQVYSGNVCTDEDADCATHGVLPDAGHDYALLTLKVTSQEELGFEDVDFELDADYVVLTSSGYEKTLGTVEDQTASVNAQAADIHCGQKYLHSWTLVNIGGHYYIPEADVGVGGGHDGATEFDYRSYHFVPIDGTIQDLCAALRGNYKLADWRSLEDLDRPSFAGEYFECGEDSVDIGVTYTDDSLEDQADAFLDQAAVVYTSDEGDTLVMGAATKFNR